MATKAGLDLVIGLVDQASAGLAKITGNVKGMAAAGEGFFGRMMETAGGFLAANVIGKGFDAAKDALGSFITSGMDAQKTEAQLDAVLKSTGAAAAAEAAQTSASAAAKAANTLHTKLSAGALAQLNQQIESTKVKHTLLNAQMQEQQQRIIDLTKKYGEHGLAVETARAKLAVMQNQAAGMDATVASLNSKLAAGSQLVGGMGGAAANAAPPIRMTKDELMSLASSLASVTPVEDDSVVAAESMLLTFTQIGKGVFPDATRAVLDMATAMNSGATPSAEQLKNTAIQVGKALNDPIKGVTALQRVGVSLTEQQKAQVKAMVEAGDVAGAQALILKELQTEFGGSAEAAGKTFAGQLQIAQNKLQSFKDDVGMQLLPALAQLMSIGQPLVDSVFKAIGNALPPLLDRTVQLADVLGTRLAQAVDWLSKTAFPALMNTWNGLQPTLAQLVADGQNLAASVMPALGQAIQFVALHSEEFKGALIAIGAVIAGAAIASGILSITAAIAALANPITWVVLAVGLLGAAWAGNWGGIRDTLTAVWNNNLKPAFDAIAAWLGVNLPIAIQAASAFWTNTLQPALQAVWQFIQANVIPAIQDAVAWLGTNIPVAVQAASAFWTNTLLPALQAVWAFITGSLIPTIVTIADWLGVKYGIAIGLAQRAWQEVLLPALQLVWDFFDQKVLPILKDIAQWLSENVPTAVETVKAKFDEFKAKAGELWDKLEPVRKVIADIADWIGSKMQPAIEGFNKFVASIKIPNPFEALYNTIGGIIDRAAAAIQKLRDLAGLNGGSSGGKATGVQSYAGGLTWVGENGPELVALPATSRIYSNSESRGLVGGDTLIFQFAAPASAYDEARIEHAVQRALDRAGRRTDVIERTR